MEVIPLVLVLFALLFYICTSQQFKETEFVRVVRVELVTMQGTKDCEWGIHVAVARGGCSNRQGECKVSFKRRTELRNAEWRQWIEPLHLRRETQMGDELKAKPNIICLSKLPELFHCSLVSIVHVSGSLMEGRSTIPPTFDPSFGVLRMIQNLPHVSRWVEIRWLGGCHSVWFTWFLFSSNRAVSPLVRCGRGGAKTTHTGQAGPQTTACRNAAQPARCRGSSPQAHCDSSDHIALPHLCPWLRSCNRLCVLNGANETRTHAWALCVSRRIHCTIRESVQTRQTNTTVR